MKLLLSKEPVDPNIGVQTAMVFLTQGTNEFPLGLRFSGLSDGQKGCLFRFLSYLKATNWEEGFYDINAPLEVLRP